MARTTGGNVIHHAIRGVHHTVKHSCRLLNHVGGYYFRNPDKAIDHGTATLRFGAMAGKAAGKAALKHGPKVIRVGGSLAVRSGVHISKMIWTHGPKAAKHGAKFMVKSAIKGFKLFT